MAQIFNEPPPELNNGEIYDTLGLVPLKEVEIAVRLLMPGKVSPCDNYVSV